VLFGRLKNAAGGVCHSDDSGVKKLGFVYPEGRRAAARTRLIVAGRSTEGEAERARAGAQARRRRGPRMRTTPRRMRDAVSPSEPQAM